MALIVLPGSVEIRVVYEKLTLGRSFLSLRALGSSGVVRKVGLFCRALRIGTGASGA